MKKIFLFLLVFLLSLTAVQASLDVDFEEYNPNPAEPGEKVILTFNVRNLDYEHGETYIIKLFADNQFLDDANKDPISFGPGEEKEVRFRLDIDDDSDRTEGKFEFAYGLDGFSWVMEDFSIRIDNEIDLKVISVSSTPEVINKGESAELKISLENDGDIDLEDIRVELDLSSMPLAPYGGVTYEKIDSMDVRDKETVYLNVIALDDADSGIYKIPIRISYEDEEGNDYEQLSYVSVRIGAIPELYILSETDYVISNDRSSVDVKLVNKGDGDIEFLDVELYNDEGYFVLGNSKEYIGQIDSDDYEDLTFDIFVNGDSVNLQLYVVYKDDSGEEYSELFSVPVKTYTKSEAKDLNLITENNNYIWIGIVVVLVIGFLIRRRIKKKRRLEEE
jgi:LPXTG-motif cell wall-anchored protein